MYRKEHIACLDALLPLRDTLDFISGKWKLQIIISLWAGNRRFREIERSIPKITTKVLSKELKDLETNQIVKRTVQPDAPHLIEYSLLPYTESLVPVIEALITWGKNHREKMFGTVSNILEE